MTVTQHESFNKGKAPNMIARITDTYSRTYSDSGQTKIYVEWIDNQGKAGRTESDDVTNPHMRALLGRAKREGIKHRREVW